MNLKHITFTGIDAAIPIKNVDAELEQYPPGIAWEMLKDLNANPIISVQEAWREHYPALLKKYRDRLFEPIKEKREFPDLNKEYLNGNNDRMFTNPEQELTDFEKALAEVIMNAKRVITEPWILAASASDYLLNEAKKELMKDVPKLD